MKRIIIDYIFDLLFIFLLSWLSSGNTLLLINGKRLLLSNFWFLQGYIGLIEYKNILIDLKRSICQLICKPNDDFVLLFWSLFSSLFSISFEFSAFPLIADKISRELVNDSIIDCCDKRLSIWFSSFLYWFSVDFWCKKSKWKDFSPSSFSLVSLIDCRLRTLSVCFCTWEFENSDSNIFNFQSYFWIQNHH